jgi:protein-disulfide isomerase
MTSRRRQASNRRARSLGIGIALAAVIVAAALLASNNTPAPVNNSTASLPGPLQIGPSNPIRGSINAPVTIYEFGDFQCPTCDLWFRNTEPLIVQNLINTNQSKLVWKDFIIYGPDSNLASKAAYAAGEQGKFWQFYDALYTNQRTPDSGWANAANLEKFAQYLGLNMTLFDQSFNSGKYNGLIGSNFSQGQRAGVQGTPTFVVVGPTGKNVTLGGAQPYSAFRQAVDAVSTTGG